MARCTAHAQRFVHRVYISIPMTNEITISVYP